MGDLQDPVARVDFRELTPAPLDQQSGDHRDWIATKPRSPDHLPAVLLPHGRGAETDLAAGRQLASLMSKRRSWRQSKIGRVKFPPEIAIREAGSPSRMRKARLAVSSPSVRPPRRSRRCLPTPI
jgi:hypothetical protein